MDQREDDRTNPWRLVQEAAGFDCRYFVARNDSVRLGAGEPRPYTYVKMKYFGIAVVPIDDRGCTTLVGQYRYVLDRFTWEVPRGGGSLSVPAIESAKAELSEETGFRADHWLQLFDASASPGLTDEFAQGFVAWGLRPGEPHPDPEERLAQRRVPFSEAVGMALSGEICDLGSIALLLGIEARKARRDLPADLMKLLGQNGDPNG